MKVILNNNILPPEKKSFKKNPGWVRKQKSKKSNLKIIKMQAVFFSLLSASGRNACTLHAYIALHLRHRRSIQSPCVLDIGL